MTYAEIHGLCEGCDYNEPCHEPHGEVTWSCDYDGDDCPTAVEHRRDNMTNAEWIAAVEDLGRRTDALVARYDAVLTPIEEELAREAQA